MQQILKRISFQHMVNIYMYCICIDECINIREDLNNKNGTSDVIQLTYNYLPGACRSSKDMSHMCVYCWCIVMITYHSHR